MLPEYELVLASATPSTSTSMSAFLSTLGQVATVIINNVVTIAEVIVSTPLLLFTTGFLLVGGCVGILGRFLSRN